MGFQISTSYFSLLFLSTSVVSWCFRKIHFAFWFNERLPTQLNRTDFNSKHEISLTFPCCCDWIKQASRLHSLKSRWVYAVCLPSSISQSITLVISKHALKLSVASTYASHTASSMPPANSQDVSHRKVPLGILWIVLWQFISSCNNFEW